MISEELVQGTFECYDCEGAGGWECPYCEDEQLCTHWTNCTVCNGTGWTYEDNNPYHAIDEDEYSYSFEAYD